MNNKLKTIKANEIKEGDLIDGYDEVTLVVTNWGKVRVWSLCNIISYNPTDLVKVLK